MTGAQGIRPADPLSATRPLRGSRQRVRYTRVRHRVGQPGRANRYHAERDAPAPPSPDAQRYAAAENQSSQGVRRLSLPMQRSRRRCRATLCLEHLGGSCALVVQPSMNAPCAPRSPCASRILNSLAASRIEATLRGACRLGPAGGGAAAIVEEAGRHASRLTGGTPCASGGWRCRCGGRPAGYWDHGAPTPRPTANRLRIGRSSAAYRPFIGCEGARQRFTHVAEPFAVVRRTRRRGGAVRVAPAPVGCARPRGASRPEPSWAGERGRPRL